MIIDFLSMACPLYAPEITVPACRKAYVLGSENAEFNSELVEF